MIIKADLKYKQPDYNLPKYSIEKVVRLSPNEFTEFVSDPLGYYDFIRKFNEEGHKNYSDHTPCLLLLGEGYEDGYIIDTQGYDYARYTAHIPNAEQLAIAFKYPSLNNIMRETALAADIEMCNMLENGNKEYVINIDEVRNRFRGVGFSEELLYAAINDRPETESAEFDGAHILCKIKDEYVRHAEPYQESTQDDVEIAIAKHILWQNDAGGEQAVFSNCVFRELNLSHHNMLNAVFENCEFIGTDFSGSELCFAVMNNCHFIGCDFTGVTAEESEFKKAVFEESVFNNGIFTHSNFTGAMFSDCEMYGGSLQNSCFDAVSNKDFIKGQVNISGISYDESDWLDIEQQGVNMLM